MLDRPDKAALLQATANFLLEEIQGAVKDKRLAFRTLIAAHLASTLAEEIRTEEARELAELGRLQALLPDDTAPLAKLSRREQIRALSRALAKRIRSGEVPEAQLGRVRAFVRQTLMETLAVVSPTFDVSPDIE